MIRAFYDADCDALVLGFEPQPFLPRSLVAARIGDMIQISRRTTGEVLVEVPYDQVARADGATGFASPAEALAYMQVEFSRWPTGAGIERSTADVDLGGHRIVRVASSGRVAIASADDPGQAGSVFGLTLGAAAAGAAVDVLTRGPTEEPSWAFAPGPAFLGLDGGLAQAPPATGFCQPVGTFTTPTRLVLALGPAVILAP